MKLDYKKKLLLLRFNAARYCLIQLLPWNCRLTAYLLGKLFPITRLLHSHSVVVVHNLVYMPQSPSISEPNYAPSAATHNTQHVKIIEEHDVGEGNNTKH
jgi:hypothetical protein